MSLAIKEFSYTAEQTTIYCYTVQPIDEPIDLAHIAKIDSFVRDKSISTCSDFYFTSAEFSSSREIPAIRFLSTTTRRNIWPTDLEEFLCAVRDIDPLRVSVNQVESLSSLLVSEHTFEVEEYSTRQLKACHSHSFYDHNSEPSIYGFENLLDIERPPYVMLDYTNKCNAKCIHCPQSVGFEGDSVKSELSLEDLSHLCDDLELNAPEIIRITGDGEPLMNPIFKQSINLLRERGLIGLTTLTTNGSLLSESISEFLINSGILMIDISLDALSQETYNRIRVGLDYDRTIKNTLRLIELRNKAGSNTKIVVSFVEQEGNKHEVLLFREYWKDLADEVLIRQLISNVDKISSDHFDSSAVNRWPCVHWFRRFVLYYGGKVKACPIDWDGQTTVAEYEASSVAEIWKNQAYSSARFAHLFNAIPSNSICKSCKDWLGTPWDKGYGSFVKRITATSTPTR